MQQPPFATRSLPAEPDAYAPYGSEIRVLLATGAASMAHGTLPPGETSLAVAHRTVEEILVRPRRPRRALAQAR